jgi:hypothetical protein
MNLRTIKTNLPVVLAAAMLFSCNSNPIKSVQKEEKLPIEGTWQLLQGTLTEKGKATVTDYTKDKKFIKIINSDHFSFMAHDLTKGKQPKPIFSSGGGKYTLNGNKYTEYLEYCNERDWENNKFDFTITIKNDTLIQQGVEKIDSLGVNRVNVEKYVRMKAE